MSMRCFLATEEALQKKEYFYKDILATISENDMFYNDKVTFESNLTDAEKTVIGNVFKEFNIYAIHSGFQFSYEPRYREAISKSFAKNALEELKWLRAFAKKKLLQQNVFMIVNLWLGKETNFNKLKMQRIDVNNWQLSEDKKFEFEYGVIYQFYDNSDEAIQRRKMRSAKQKY